MKDTIENLRWLTNSIDESLTEKLNASFEKFYYSISSNNLTISQQKKAIEQLSNYLNKKADETLGYAASETSYYDLKKLRNELVHGRGKRDINPTMIYPQLWMAISKMAEKVGPYDIENLLSYSLFVENKHLSDRGYSPNRIVRVYHKMFESLDEEWKNRVFADLLLRLFSDSESMALLKAP